MQSPASKLIRAAALTYLCAFALRMVDGFMMVHQWPSAALSYLAWSMTQLNSEFLQKVSYIWVFIAACSATGALGVLAGRTLFRAVFAAAFGGILICEMLITSFGNMPYLVTPYQNLIGDIGTLAAGVLIGISVLDRNQN